jgi:hypothetical protein
MVSGSEKIADNGDWDPALARTLAPGACTAQLSAADVRAGEVPIEIDELP